MAHSSPPPAYCEKLIIVLIGEDTQLKTLVGQLLCGPADSVATEDGLVVMDNGTFKAIDMPDLSGAHQSDSITDCMALSQPGPHLFILTIDSINIHMKKVEEDIRVLHKYFGDDIISHLVVMVKDIDSYQMLRPLEDKLGFRLATANENMQRQCKEWCSGPAYNYEHSMNNVLTRRRKALETELRRDQQHLRTPRPTTDKKPLSGPSTPQVDAHPAESAPGRSTDGEPAEGPTSSQTAPEPAPESRTGVEPAGETDNVFNIILMGQTASGKSASANTILSTLSYFMPSKHHFKSELKSVPVTTKCEAVMLKAFGAKIRIVDTPDFFHDQVEDAEAQVDRCRDYCRPDRCVVLLVMQAGRFTDGEREILHNLEDKMGWRIRDNTVLLLTNGDNLSSADSDAYINGQTELRNLVFQCHDRCVLFNNNSKKPQQVMELMRTIPDYRRVFPKLTDAVSKSTLLFMMSSPL